MGSSPQQENTNPASDAYNFLTPRSPLPRMPQMQSTPEMRKAIQHGQPQANKDTDIFAGLA